MRAILFVFGALLATLACGPQRPPATAPPPPCEALQTRCDGTVVQLCSADGAWIAVEDCAQVLPQAAQCTPAGCVREGPATAATLTRAVVAADVVSWAVHLQRQLDFEVFNALDEQSPIATLNDWMARLGVLDRDAYRTRFATTIGRAVFVPFALGTPLGPWSLDAQIRVLGHEATHVVQNTPNLPQFAWRYLTAPAYRAAAEAEAYAADAEIGWQLWRAPPQPQWVFDALGSYLLRDGDRAFARSYMGLRMQTIVVAQSYSSRACVEVLSWGRARGLIAP